MKRKFIFSSIILIGVFIFLIVYKLGDSYSMKDIITDSIGVNPVTYINILETSSNKEIRIKDENKIKEILDGFYDLKLKKSKESNNINKNIYYIKIDSIDTSITNSVNNHNFLGITLYDSKYITIYNSTNSSSNTYLITSSFDDSSIKKFLSGN